MRVESLLREEISTILQRKLKDPRVTLVSITRVEADPDLHHARIYVSAYGDKDHQRGVLEGLRSAAGFIRAELMHVLHLRPMPSLEFRYDEALEQANHTLDLLDRIRAAPRAVARSGVPVMGAPDLTGPRQQTVELIRASEAVYVGTHVRPDGDALGSTLALGLAIQAAGRQLAFLCADPVPPEYRFLPGADQISSRPPAWPADLGIVVDCDGLARVGVLEPVFSGLPHLVDIDHHATDRVFGEVVMADATAGATGEVVWDLLRAAGFPVTAEIATCLYTAIVTDTGRFGYANTTARSLAIAAELVAAGADPHLVTRKVYEEGSIAATHLLGLALSRLSSDFDDQVVSSTLALQDFADTGAIPSDTEGIIDHLRRIGGTRVALLFVELEDHQVRVSLRSDGSVDVSQIAFALGGGGHMAAAGCTLEGSTESVREKVLAAVRRTLP
jgi:phosphoesterase RecJ-like protein